MKRKNFKSKIAVIAAAILTMSLGTDLTASAEADEVAINSTNFPDEKFRDYVSENFDDDNSGGLSYFEIFTEKFISIENKGFSSLKGIEYFTNLENLDCHNNNLTQLDVSNCAALKYLNCSNNSLTQLDVSNCAALHNLNCYNNNLTKLDVSNNTDLYNLNCYNNNLTKLDVSNNTDLYNLYCNNNSLTQLDVSNNTDLKRLSCNNNNLAKLDMSNNTALTSFDCSDNNLTKLNVSNNTTLTELDCYNNNLTQLDVSNCTALTELDCYNNNLTQLDVSNNTDLLELCCYDNNLTQLDVSKNTVLYKLRCSNNNLTQLDVSNNTRLEELECADNNLSYVDISNTCIIFQFYINNNIYTIPQGTTFDTAAIPGFDKSKVSNVTNAVYAPATGIFSNITGDITYTYDCGKSFLIQFKLSSVSSNSILTDRATGIQLTLDNTDIAKNLKLNVTKVNDEAVPSGTKAGYQITLTDISGNEVQPSGNIELTIPVPENVNGANAKVFRKETDGTFTDMNAVYNPQSNTLSFVTEHLSIYAVVSGTVQGDVNNDGYLTPRDLTILGKAYMQETVTAEQIAAADMDGNGKITPKDITALGKLYMSMQK